MGLRPSSELIQSLRLTLQKLEENFASAEDEPNIAELKRILLLRIAEIEAVDAVNAEEANDAQLTEPVVEHSPDLAITKELGTTVSENISHTGFRTASEEARLRIEKEMLSDTAANLGAELLWQSMASGVFWPTPC